MGDRANICIKETGGGTLYFYSHWKGTDLYKDLAKALKRGKNRWGDETYLARIIFSEMIRDDVMSETGFGISTYETDNTYPIPYVKMGSQTISLEEKTYAFEEFIKEFGKG